MTFLGHVVAVGGFGEVGQRRGRGCELHFATEATVAGGVSRLEQYTTIIEWTQATSIVFLFARPSVISMMLLLRKSSESFLVGFSLARTRLKHRRNGSLFELA